MGYNLASSSFLYKIPWANKRELKIPRRRRRSKRRHLQLTRSSGRTRAMAAKTSPKKRINAFSNFITLIPSLLVCHRLAIFSGVEFWKITSYLTKEKENRCLAFPSSIEWFSFECRKTKTKVITLANHIGHRQYIEPIKTRSNYMWLTQSAGKSCERVTIGFGFTSDWMKRWRESFKPIASCRKCKTNYFSTLKWKPL